MGSPVTESDLPPLTATADLCTRFSWLIQVRDLFGEFLGWLLGPDGELSDEALEGVADRMVPIGTILMYGSSTPPSPKFLSCNGQTVSRATYPTLFDRFGTSFGTGDGTANTFSLPNLTNRFAVGQGGSYALGSTGGAVSVTMGAGNIPEHYHGVAKAVEAHSANNDAVFGVRTWTKPTNGTTAGFLIKGDGIDPATSAAITDGDIATTTSIADIADTPTPFSTLPPYVAVHFIVKAL